MWYCLFSSQQRLHLTTITFQTPRLSWWLHHSIPSGLRAASHEDPSIHECIGSLGSCKSDLHLQQVGYHSLSFNFLIEGCVKSSHHWRPRQKCCLVPQPSLVLTSLPVLLTVGVHPPELSFSGWIKTFPMILCVSCCVQFHLNYDYRPHS